MGISIIRLKDREVASTSPGRNYIGGMKFLAWWGLNPLQKEPLNTGKKSRNQNPGHSQDFVRYGTEAEEHLRALFALDFPSVSSGLYREQFSSQQSYPWAAASRWNADGRDRSKGSSWNQRTNILQSIQKENGIIKSRWTYYTQVLFYLAVTEFEFVELKGPTQV